METLLHIGLSNAVVATVLALGVLLLARVIRQPALIHTLWLLVLIKLVTPPLVTVAFPLPARPEPVLAEDVPPPKETAADVASTGESNSLVAATLPTADTSQERPSSETPAETLTTTESAVATPSLVAWSSQLAETLDWQTLVTGSWLACSAFWLGLAGWRIVRFQRHLGAAQPAPAWLQGQCDDLADRMGLRSGPSVWLIPGAVSPMLWALATRPRLLVPTALWARLDDEQRQTLLLHELAHLRRGDYWVRGLELLATGLFWWFPMLWLARRELREAEEQCCDAWVVWALPGSARAYASALMTTIDYLSEARPALSPVASGFGHATFLKRRLTMILRGTTPRALPWAGLVVVLGLSAVLLPVQAGVAKQDAPPRVQPPPRDEEEQQPRQEDEARRRAEELERARQMVQKMQEEMAKMRDQLRAAEERFRQAQEQLERAAQQTERSRRPGAGGGDAPGRPQGAPDRRPEPRATEPRRVTPPSPDRGGPREPRGTEQRLTELEQRLDAVMRQLEAIRRDLQPREGGRGGFGGGGGSGGPPGVGPGRGVPGPGGPGAGPGGPGGGSGSGGGTIRRSPQPTPAATPTPPTLPALPQPPRQPDSPRPTPVGGR